MLCEQAYDWAIRSHVLVNTVLSWHRPRACFLRSNGIFLPRHAKRPLANVYAACLAGPAAVVCACRCKALARCQGAGHLLVLPTLDVVLQLLMYSWLLALRTAGVWHACGKAAASCLKFCYQSVCPIALPHAQAVPRITSKGVLCGSVYRVASRPQMPSM
jgi:hypothetical protein